VVCPECRKPCDEDGYCDPCAEKAVAEAQVSEGPFTPLFPAPPAEKGCEHRRGSMTEAEGYEVHRCLDCGAVNFNSEGWRGGTGKARGT
jgi:hypothetical protein